MSLLFRLVDEVLVTYPGDNTSESFPHYPRGDPSEVADQAIILIYLLQGSEDALIVLSSVLVELLKVDPGPY